MVDFSLGNDNDFHENDHKHTARSDLEVLKSKLLKELNYLKFSNLKRDESTLFRTKKPLKRQRLKFLWSWRESNPRPNIFPKSFLHAYLRIDLSGLGRGATNQPRPYPFSFQCSLTETMSIYPPRFDDSAAAVLAGAD